VTRRTKIVATIGPASDSATTLRGLIRAGMDVARLGLAHGTVDDAIERVKRIRQIAEEERSQVGILIDLPGPKVRVATFPDGGVEMENDHEFRLRPGSTESSRDVVEVDYEGVLNDIEAGDTLDFGDGNIAILVESVNDSEAMVRVTHGGHLEGRPGLRIPSDRLSMGTPTRSDLDMLDGLIDQGIDMVAVSFVRSAQDMRRVGTEPHPRGPLLIAKIETRAAVENLPGIIETSGAIMVARGDLGGEYPIEEVPHLQKKIIRDCIAGGLPVITATQMLDSMVHSPSPTRAEATDVANAVFDGTSGVMLSAETAIGDHPVRVVQTMARIAERADEEFDYQRWGQRIGELRLSSSQSAGTTVTDALTMAGWRVSNELNLSALICISGTGFTARSVARFRPQTPILAFSTDPRTVSQLTVSWGVTPLQADISGAYEERVNGAVLQARQLGYVRPGDLVGVLAGVDATVRSTDVLRLVRVP
jgi:pyruvate kinase